MERTEVYLELLEEVASRAGDVDSAGDAALAVLDALDDAGGLGALGTIGALLCIHDLFAVAGFGNLRHCEDLPEAEMWRGLTLAILWAGLWGLAEQEGGSRVALL